MRSYYAELVHGIQTSDATRLRRMVTKGCPCYGAVKAIEANAEHDRHGPDVRININELRIHDVGRGSGSAEVKYEVNAYPLVDGDGRVVSRIPAREDFVDLSLVKSSSGTWIIGNVFNLES